MSLSNEDKEIKSTEPDTNVNSAVDVVTAKTCEKCGGVLEVNEVGFFKSSEVIVAYFFGAILILGNFWLMFFSGIEKPNSGGDGKSIFLVPAFVVAVLYKIKQNSRKKILKCTECSNAVEIIS